MKQALQSSFIANKWLILLTVFLLPYWALADSFVASPDKMRWKAEASAQDLRPSNKNLYFTPNELSKTTWLCAQNGMTDLSRKTYLGQNQGVPSSLLLRINGRGLNGEAVNGKALLKINTKYSTFAYQNNGIIYTDLFGDLYVSLFEGKKFLGVTKRPRVRVISYYASYIPQLAGDKTKLLPLSRFHRRLLVKTKQGLNKVSISKNKVLAHRGFAISKLNPGTFLGYFDAYNGNTYRRSHLTPRPFSAYLTTTKNTLSKKTLYAFYSPYELKVGINLNNGAEVDVSLNNKSYIITNGQGYISIKVPADCTFRPESSVSSSTSSSFATGISSSKSTATSSESSSISRSSSLSKSASSMSSRRSSSSSSSSSRSTTRGNTCLNSATGVIKDANGCITKENIKEIPVMAITYLPKSSSNPLMLNYNLTGEDVSLQAKRDYLKRITDLVFSLLNDASRYRGYKNAQATPFARYVPINKYSPTLPYILEFSEAVPWDPDNSNSVNCIWKGTRRICHPDYKTVLTTKLIQKTGHDICYYVDTLGLKEVWLYSQHVGYEKSGGSFVVASDATSPYVLGPVESDMSMGTFSQQFWNHGSYGDVSNSWQSNDLPQCTRTYTLFNYNIKRGVGEAVENHTHQIERLFNFADTNGSKGWLYKNLWVGWPNGQKSFYRCGWTHYPPNVMKYTSNHDYDWDNPEFALTDCENWTPLGTGSKKALNCNAWAMYGQSSTCWGSSDNYRYIDAGFKTWWIQNIPQDTSLTYDNQKLRNWWEFIADFDFANCVAKSLVYPSGLNISEAEKVCLQSIYGSIKR
ncbi:MAG: hypothetical protein IT292_01420 [Deltaproteobacteria bacterium]|nr:hypothetical protein [Deltaproteobacteria bacterium]